jgi:RNA polymerase sigma-70 factor (ECF subfamily)
MSTAAAVVEPPSAVRLTAATPPGCCRVARSAGVAHCTVLLRSADGNAAFADARLARLVEHLWPEVKGLVRREVPRGLDADDLTQAYFARFIEKGTMRQLETWRGCFRPFLRTTVRNFVANARDHARAVKRGGRLRRVPLDLVPDSALRRTFPGGETPESLLLLAERRRAVARAVFAVRAAMKDRRQRERFETTLRLIVTGGDGRDLARAWGVRPVAVRVAAHRLKRRLADAVCGGCARGAGKTQAASV